MNDDLSPESLRQLYKERAAADDSIRKSREQQALYQGSEVMEIPADEAAQRDLLSASFAKLDASLRNIDYNLEAAQIQRVEQIKKEHSTQRSSSAKLDRLEALYKSQFKVAQLRQRALITIGLLNLAVTTLLGILILTLK